VAWFLMLVFFLVPYLRWAGKPLILLDLPRREFTLFGATFLPTETVLFMLLLISAILIVVFLTALTGRVWCGWACPQTVYLEFLFRPVEYLLEGGWRGTTEMDKSRRPGGRRALKQVVFFLFALFLAHTFLAYFIGIERLATWVRRSPLEHPTSFLVMLGTTLLIFADFSWFREQTCLVACPYGRLQSALLDRRSLVVGYDARRGEPRRKGVVHRPAAAGDCIDCGNCVRTCPTGIDIRDGLQMECIHCTQCIDACNAVMVHVGKPTGLIRYGSRDGLEGKRGSWLRPRVVIYPLALALSVGALVAMLGARGEPEVTLLRGSEAYTLQPDGRVANQIRVKIANRGAAREFRISLPDLADATVIVPSNPFPVPAGGTRETSIFVVVPRERFGERGERAVTILLDDGGKTRAYPYRLLGPAGEEAAP
jgi:cytochrome c oxidase accessory protein FixG